MDVSTGKPADDLTGEYFGGYKLDELVGTGGMASIYKGFGGFSGLDCQKTSVSGGWASQGVRWLYRLVDVGFGGFCGFGTSNAVYRGRWQWCHEGQLIREKGDLK